MFFFHLIARQIRGRKHCPISGRLIIKDNNLVICNRMGCISSSVAMSNVGTGSISPTLWKNSDIQKFDNSLFACRLN
ncbi:hypothetical protein DERF_004759 [Dermatophagoides farinae]|uniref:Uncharacterized protein n=1 Tax=Dermatophagoides farinae TaxID=6954 RepID=A0A922L5J9_DERFA|nr:hypothetical protein DERF_004759 [Dermatophagoides farinae]